MNSGIEVTKLINQLKKDLLSTNADDVPLLSVDEIEIELQVVVKDEGKAGIKLYIFDLSGSSSVEGTQKIKIKLSPIFDKATLLDLYQASQPEKSSSTLSQSLGAVFKGEATNNLDDEII